MSLQTQIRRALLSALTLTAFGTVAFVQGEGVQPLDASVVEIVAEADAAREAIAVTVPAVRVDWRASLPATIARSRS